MRLWLECEGRSEPRRTGHVAAAARAQVIRERESMKRQIEELEWARREAPSRSLCLRSVLQLPRNLPEECPEPLSAPITPEDIDCLNVRRAPSYFRLPKHAVHFAMQIFRYQSREDAVAKANFNSWVVEARVERVEDMPDYFVCGNKAVHKYDVRWWVRVMQWIRTTC